MQRRAAAAYVAILAAVAAGAIYGIWSGASGELLQKLWALGLMSGLAAVVLLAAAYMPVRRD